MGLKVNDKKAKFMALSDSEYMIQCNGQNFVIEQCTYEIVKNVVYLGIFLNMSII